MNKKILRDSKQYSGIKLDYIAINKQTKVTYNVHGFKLGEDKYIDSVLLSGYKDGRLRWKCLAGYDLLHVEKIKERSVL